MTDDTDPDSGSRLTPEAIAEASDIDLSDVSEEELTAAIDELIQEGIVEESIDPETGERYVTLSEEGAELGFEAAKLQGDEGILDTFECWLAHHYQRSEDAETAFRATAAAIRDRLEVNIVTVLERNDWELPGGSTFDIRRMPAIHLEAARAEYEPAND